LRHSGAGNFSNGVGDGLPPSNGENRGTTSNNQNSRTREEEELRRRSLSAEIRRSELPEYYFLREDVADDIRASNFLDSP
jgi:hypothetical protein